MIIKKTISGLAEREALVATLDNPVKLDGFDFDKKPCTTATIPVVQGQKLSRTPLPSFWRTIGQIIVVRLYNAKEDK